MTRLAHRPPRSRRRQRVFAGSVLAAFGGVSALVQFVGQLYPRAFPDPGWVTIAAVACCTAWGAVRTRPLHEISHDFEQPPMTVTITGGDLFAEDAHLVVGFTDTFATAVATATDAEDEDAAVVNPDSVQAQLLRRHYAGDRRRLDAELDGALAGVTPAAVLDPALSPPGKLRRYPIGTVAVLGTWPHLVFGVAYSRLGPHRVATSSTEDLWYSLDRLWDAVYRHGEQTTVAIPLIGSGLARLDLSDELLLRLVILSFVVRSRNRRVCRELRIVIRPGTLRRLDLPEIEAFLKSLGPGGSRRR